jgi:sugar phosphate isomerase/epimerase
MVQIILCDDTELEKIDKIAKKNKFGVEVQLFSKPKHHLDKNIEIHKKTIKGINPISMHGIFHDLNPGSTDPLLRNIATKRFNQSYKVARKLNAKNIIFHIGYVPGTGNTTNWVKRCVDFWNEFLKGKSKEINFYIENMLEHNPDMLFDVIQGINKNNVKVCLDLGHAHCYSKTSVLKWIEKLQDEIGYVHIHDNNGLKDEHLGIGKGNIPMKKILNALKKYSPNAKWALEVNTKDMNQTITWLKENNYIN